MDNQLIIQDSTPQKFIGLSSKEEELTGILYHVNQLTSFPLTMVQIQDWAITINDFYPDLDVEILKTIIRKFKVGRYKWNNKEGIQNICETLTDLRIIDRYSLKEDKENEEAREKYMNNYNSK